MFKYVSVAIPNNLFQSLLTNFIQIQMWDKCSEIRFTTIFEIARVGKY